MLLQILHPLSILNGQLLYFVDNFFLEIEQGKIRWYHINPAGHKVFFIVTESLLPAKTWVHVAGTYSVLTGEVKFFINAEESKITKGDGNELFLILYDKRPHEQIVD